MSFSVSVTSGCNLSMKDIGGLPGICVCGTARHLHPREPSDVRFECAARMMSSLAMRKQGCLLAVSEVKGKRCTCGLVAAEHFPGSTRSELHDFIRKSFAPDAHPTGLSPVVPTGQTSANGPASAVGQTPVKSARQVQEAKLLTESSGVRQQSCPPEPAGRESSVGPSEKPDAKAVENPKGSEAPAGTTTKG